MLRQRRIAHTLHRFDPGIGTAAGVAESLGLAPESVYKTLVFDAEPPTPKPLLLIAPATIEVDMKALARSLGVRRTRMASQRDAELHTGMRVGGISAIPLSSRGLRVYIASDALSLETIYVSAGERGADVGLAVEDLLAITNATPVSIH